MSGRNPPPMTEWGFWWRVVGVTVAWGLVLAWGLW